MKRTMIVLLVGATALTFAEDLPLEAWRPLQVRYTIFSGGSLADREAPTSTDRKLTILVDGHAAKEIFDSIGPDMPSSCSDEKGNRSREKQGVQCFYTARRGVKGYQCWIGVNLRTGKSIPTASC